MSKAFKFKKAWDNYILNNTPWSEEDLYNFVPTEFETHAYWYENCVTYIGTLNDLPDEYLLDTEDATLLPQYMLDSFDEEHSLFKPILDIAHHVAIDIQAEPYVCVNQSFTDIFTPSMCSNISGCYARETVNSKWRKAILVGVDDTYKCIDQDSGEYFTAEHIFLPVRATPVYLFSVTKSNGNQEHRLISYAEYKTMPNPDEVTIGSDFSFSRHYTTANNFVKLITDLPSEVHSNMLYIKQSLSLAQIIRHSESDQYWLSNQIAEVVHKDTEERLRVIDVFSYCDDNNYEIWYATLLDQNKHTGVVCTLVDLQYNYLYTTRFSDELKAFVK